MKKYFFILLLVCVAHISNANIVVLNGLTHSYSVEHGSIHSGQITIQNTSKEIRNIKVYINDYAYNANGEIFYGELGTSDRSNGSWIDLKANMISLKPNEKYELFYEILVPESTVFDGSYWSVIMIEPADDVEPNNDKSGINVQTVIRYAIQIVTTVQNLDSKSAITFANPEIQMNNGKRYLVCDIINDGDLFHKVSSSIDLFNAESGEEIGKINGNTVSLLPGLSKKISIDLTTLKKGSYQVVLLADCGEDNLYGLNIELNIENE